VACQRSFRIIVPPMKSSRSPSVGGFSSTRMPARRPVAGRRRAGNQGIEMPGHRCNRSTSSRPVISACGDPGQTRQMSCQPSGTRQRSESVDRVPIISNKNAMDLSRLDRRQLWLPRC
jgi:hypothetical protein